MAIATARATAPDAQVCNGDDGSGDVYDDHTGGNHSKVHGYISDGNG